LGVHRTLPPKELLVVRRNALKPFLSRLGFQEEEEEEKEVEARL